MFTSGNIEELEQHRADLVPGQSPHEPIHGAALHVLHHQVGGVGEEVTERDQTAVGLDVVSRRGLVLFHFALELRLEVTGALPRLFELRLESTPARLRARLSLDTTTSSHWLLATSY